MCGGGFPCRALSTHRCWRRGSGRSWASTCGSGRCSSSSSRCSSVRWWCEDRAWTWPPAWWLPVAFQQPWAIRGSRRRTHSSFRFLQTTVLFPPALAVRSGNPNSPVSSPVLGPSPSPTAPCPPPWEQWETWSFRPLGNMVPSTFLALVPCVL